MERQIYELLISQLKSLFRGETNRVANLSNAAALLHTILNRCQIGQVFILMTAMNSSFSFLGPSCLCRNSPWQGCLRHHVQQSGRLCGWRMSINFQFPVISIIQMLMRVVKERETAGVFNMITGLFIKSF